MVFSPNFGHWCEKVLEARKSLDTNDGKSILSSCQRSVGKNEKK
jgi:hypothetical protein